MAKLTKAARAAEEARRAVDAAVEREPSLADDVTQDINTIFDGLPAEADLRLYRKNASNSKLEFCQTFAEPRDFSEEAVAKRWGPGSYRIIARVPDPKTGKLQFAQGLSKAFSIAEPPDHNAGRAGPGLAAPGSMDFQQTMAAQLWTMLTTQAQQMQQYMAQSQESHRAMIAMMLQQRPDSTGELVKVMLPLLVQRENPMDMAVKIAELVKPAGPAASLVEQLGALREAVKLFRDGEAPDDAPPWLKGLTTVAPLIEKALTLPRPAGAPAVPAAPPAAPALPPPRNANAAPAAPTNGAAPAASAAPGAAEAADPVSRVLLAVDAAVPMLLRGAERHGDPTVYADVLVDSIEEELWPVLDGVVQDARAIQFLQERHPALLPHTAWLQQLVAAVHASFADEEGPDAPPDDAPAP